MKDMALLISSNIEFTGLLLGTFSAALGLAAFIGLICILVDETKKYKYRQKQDKNKTNLKR